MTKIRLSKSFLVSDFLRLHIPFKNKKRNEQLNNPDIQTESQISKLHPAYVCVWDG